MLESKQMLESSYLSERIQDLAKSTESYLTEVDCMHYAQQLLLVRTFPSGWSCDSYLSFIANNFLVLCFFAKKTLVFCSIYLMGNHLDYL